MAALGSPARTFRGLLRELRHLSAATGRPYRDTPAYRYLVKAFRAHRVTGEKLCRAQQELHFQAATYLCLLRSVREHMPLVHLMPRPAEAAGRGGGGSGPWSRAARGLGGAGRGRRRRVAVPSPGGDNQGRQ
ncbi:PREDICTED: UPF0562 protein C7orf55-like [Elephantulus edwardii]|uniref:UPF0562 protein C7orf55-like n=1 Tax=Elephantulus edwardii TaxID=28737 RepID=UPI0003F08BE2|nr:PREDICTED: UPF0562 protein C7orf55-like [Elephantulus edwardii]